MLSLALHYGEGPVYLKDIAKEENISEKYLSLIVMSLRGAGLLRSSRGAYGGYCLSREPSQITLKEIVDILEGDSFLVDCVKHPSICPRVSTCVSHDVWAIIDGKIAKTLNSITLNKLVKMSRKKRGRAQ
jgi:Rrf2 family protein